MHTVWRGVSPPGRRVVTCKILGYSGRVETRRKEVGRQIKAARRLKKFRSQRAFADHIDVSESSVANAETGSDRIGEGVFAAIEDGLKWPIGSITAYIGGADKEPWVLAGEDLQSGSESPPAPVVERRLWPTDAEIIAMSTDDLARFALNLQRDAGSQQAEDWLFHALSVRREAALRNLTLRQMG
jgi:hypothetical protein